MDEVKSSKDGIDILLLGDSITQYWGGSAIDKTPFNAAWKNNFGKYKTVNIGIGGDRTENVLWRLEHGAVEGASPKVIVLLIGANDAPLVAANGVPPQAVAQGIKLCVDSLRAKCPASQVVVLKILPAFTPGNAVYEAIKNVSRLLDEMKLDADPKVHILDLWSDFANPDGSLKAAAYADGRLHLSPAGYEIWAGKLKPLVEQFILKK